MKTIDELRTLVDQVFNEEADFDEVLAQLSHAISANTDSAELLELRISLNKAARNRAAVWHDRKRLLALRPDDLDLALIILQTQHHWSELLAEHEYANQLEEIGASNLDQASEAEAQAIQSSPGHLGIQDLISRRSHALAEAATEEHFKLMEQHAHNVGNAEKIFASWGFKFQLLPWHSYRLILTALRIQPNARIYRKAMAMHLASLAQLQEEGVTKVPTGYFVDHILGNLHARTAYDALAAIDAIEGFEQDPELLSSRAVLQQAIGDYAEAAKSHRLIVKHCKTMLPNADETEQEELKQKMAAASQAAINCDIGRQALHDAHFASLGNAIDQAQFKLEAFNEELRIRFGVNQEETERPDFQETKESLRAWQDKVNELTAAGLTEEKKSTLREKAANTAARIVGLVRFTPVVLSPMNRSDFSSEVSPWFDEVEPALRAANLEFAGWFQNLQTVEALQKEAPGQLWLANGHDFVVTVEATDKVRLKRCLTEFSDGTIMTTADTRGGGYYSSGPKVDGFGVFKSTPLEEMIAIHRARLAAKLAGFPDLRVIPADGLKRAEEIEGRMKRHANEFRLKYGITDAEIRGMNIKHHAFFAAELKREVAERIAQIVVPQ
ncbi:MAG TPA: hypothetical protein VF472_13990 [Burkholderiaceae bacterium]